MYNISMDKEDSKMKSIKRKAQSLIEYGLILALVAVVAIAALQILGKKVNNAATTAGEHIDKTSQNAAQTYCEQSVGGTWDTDTGVCTPPENN